MENSDATLTVYGKPACVQCTATERYLSSRERSYIKIDVTKDAEAFDMLIEMGYQQVPVVVAEDGTHWGGFDPDRLAQYA